MTSLTGSSDWCIYYRPENKLLKIITPWYLRSQTRTDIEAFTKEVPWQKSSVGSRDKSPFYKAENKFRVLVITEEAGLPQALQSWKKYFRQTLFFM